MCDDFVWMLGDELDEIWMVGDVLNGDELDDKTYGRLVGQYRRRA